MFTTDRVKYIQLTEFMFNNRQSGAYNRQSKYLQRDRVVGTTGKVMYITDRVVRTTDRVNIYNRQNWPTVSKCLQPTE